MAGKSTPPSYSLQVCPLNIFQEEKWNKRFCKGRINSAGPRAKWRTVDSSFWGWNCVNSVGFGRFQGTALENTLWQGFWWQSELLRLLDLEPMLRHSNHTDSPSGPGRYDVFQLGGDVPEGHGKPKMYSGFFKNRIGQTNLMRLWTLLPVQSRLRLCIHDEDLKWRRVFTFYFTFSRGKLHAYGYAKVGWIRLGTHAGRLNGAVMHSHIMPPISTHVRGIFLLLRLQSVQPERRRQCVDCNRCC